MTVVKMMTPPVIIDVPAEVIRIDRVLDDCLNYFQRAMDACTRGWKPENRPEWKRKRIMAGGARWVELRTTSVPFCYVNEGTEGPYPIPKAGPKPGGLGPFQIGYVPRTTPGSLRSGSSRRFGPWVRPKRVMHPGIEARDFTGIAMKQVEEKFLKCL